MAFANIGTSQPIDEQKENGPTFIPLISQVPAYLAKRREEKCHLERDISKLSAEKSDLEHQNIAVVQAHKKLYEDFEVDKAKIQWYSQLKEGLERAGFSADNIPRLVKGASWLQERGYNFSEILDNFSEHKRLVFALGLLHEEVSKNTEIAQSLHGRITCLKNILETNTVTLSILDELKSKGIGLKELKGLNDFISEISTANGLPIHDGSAFRRLLDDMESGYDMSLGFRTKIQEIQEQRKDLANLSHMSARR